ncbi:TerD family protein [archaeon]|nr:TerD family protein [archaeon]
MLDLNKGTNINLSKEYSLITNFKVKIKWDVHTTNLSDFNIDANAILLKEDGKVRNDFDLIFYNCMKAQSDSPIIHKCATTSEVNNEEFDVSLNKIPNDVNKVAFTLTIYKGEKRKQSFKQVRNAYVTLVDATSNVEIAKYSFENEDTSITSLILCEIYKHNNDWKFKAVGQGFNHGMKALEQNYGIGQ